MEQNIRQFITDARSYLFGLRPAQPALIAARTALGA